MDTLGIGLDIANDGSVIRATFWEITAIPDIREQTASLAGRIVQWRHA